MSDKVSAVSDATQEAKPVMLGDVVAGIVRVLKMMRAETIHVSQEAYDAVSVEIAKLEADVKPAATELHDTVGAVVAHLAMDELRPLELDAKKLAEDVESGHTA